MRVPTHYDTAERCWGVSWQLLEATSPLHVSRNGYARRGVGGERASAPGACTCQETARIETSKYWVGWRRPPTRMCAGVPRDSCDNSTASWPCKTMPKQAPPADMQHIPAWSCLAKSGATASGRSTLKHSRRTLCRVKRMRDRPAASGDSSSAGGDAECTACTACTAGGGSTLDARLDARCIRAGVTVTWRGAALPEVSVPASRLRRVRVRAGLRLSWPLHLPPPPICYRPHLSWHSTSNFNARIFRAQARQNSLSKRLSGICTQ